MCFSGLKQKGHISGGWSAGCVPEVSRSLRFVFSRQTLTWLPRGERRRKGPHSNRTARKHANNILGSMCDNSWLSRVCIVAKVSSHSLHRYWPCAGKRRGGGGERGIYTYHAEANCVQTFRSLQLQFVRSTRIGPHTMPCTRALWRLSAFELGRGSSHTGHG